jgi:hypothetical protein
MFKTQGPSVLRVTDNYHCSGAGAYLGDYLMRRAFDRRMKIKGAVLLAIQGFSAVKQYDPNCGGDTQFMMIRSGGHASPMVPYQIPISENYIAEFEQLSSKLLFNIGDADLSDEKFDTWLKSFDDEVRRIRSFWKGQGFSYLLQQLSHWTSAEAQRDLQSPGADPLPPSPESPEASGKS